MAGTFTGDGSERIESEIRDLISGQFKQPRQVVALNVAESWAKDVSKVIAVELHAGLRSKEFSFASTVKEFVDQAI